QEMVVMEAPRAETPLEESLPKDLHLDTGTGSYCGSSVCSYSSSDEAEGSEGEAAASPDPAELPGTPEPELVPMPRWVEGSRTISTPDLESLSPILFPESLQSSPLLAQCAAPHGAEVFDWSEVLKLKAECIKGRSSET
ncbi:unnamed protein product, partial [Durusdinium trenchii]